MADQLHPMAPHELPQFIPSADGSDLLLTLLIFTLIIGLIAAGAFYLYLHSLPEKLAHGNHRVQFEVVGILALLALFTHNNLFWVAALLLAVVRFPDYVTPLESLADSAKRLADHHSPETKAAAPDQKETEPSVADQFKSEHAGSTGKGEPDA